MALPTLVPNQRANKNKKALRDEDNHYTYMNLEAMERAMNELRPSAFKLWCYLNKNMDGYEQGLSFSAVHKFCNMSQNTYLAAFNELYEKNYIFDYVFPNGIVGYLFVEDGGKNKQQTKGDKK